MPDPFNNLAINYGEFAKMKSQDRLFESDFDRMIKQLPNFGDQP